MKYLTLFILIIYVLFNYVESNSSNVDVTNQALKKGSNTKTKKKQKIVTSFTFPTTKAKSNPITEGDLMVCQTGRNLGLMEMGNSCMQKYPGSCQRIIKRDKAAPTLSKIKKNKLAKKELRLSKKSAIKRKPKKKWSLRARLFKFHPELKKKWEEQQRKKAITKRIQRKRKNEAKRIVDQLVSKGLYSKPVSRKTLKKEAKNLVEKLKQGNISALRKALNLKAKKSKKIARKPWPENGNYCVHAVVWNLNHCCYFNKKSLAKRFANTQPDDVEFQKKLRNGWIAHIRDREREGKKVIEKTNKALKLLNKNKKVLKKLRERTSKLKKLKKGKNNKSKKNKKKN